MKKLKYKVVNLIEPALGLADGLEHISSAF